MIFILRLRVFVPQILFLVKSYIMTETLNWIVSSFDRVEKFDHDFLTICEF